MLREPDNFDEISEETALLAFMTDFLERNGFGDTVRSLQREASNLNHQILSEPEISNLLARVQSLRELAETRISRTQSVLFEWWQVFWKVLKEKNREKGVRERECEKEKEKEKEKEDKMINADPCVEVNQSQSRIDFSNYQLDMETLVNIEKCLKQARVLNKGLNRLSSVELRRIEALLKSNKISSNSWRQYLSLCKEYQKANTQFKNEEPSSSSSASKSTSYLGVIDQINQPMDSRELLILRQSLYHEYTKRQQMHHLENDQQLQKQQKQKHNQDQDQDHYNHHQQQQQISNFEQQEEVNFDDFINEYLL